MRVQRALVGVEGLLLTRSQVKSWMVENLLTFRERMKEVNEGDRKPFSVRSTCRLASKGGARASRGPRVDRADAAQRLGQDFVAPQRLVRCPGCERKADLVLPLYLAATHELLGV